MESITCRGRNVSWLPSYGPEMRGGTANCSVVVSDDPIASPVLSMADCVIAMNTPSLDKFEANVLPGGKLFINSSIIDKKATRTDIDVYYVPCSEVDVQFNMNKSQKERISYNVEAFIGIIFNGGIGIDLM